MDDASSTGLLAVGVPGTLKAWCHILEHYGTLPLATVMSPAIRHATNGFRASECALLFLHPMLGHAADPMSGDKRPHLTTVIDLRVTFLRCVQIPRGYHQEF